MHNDDFRAIWNMLDKLYADRAGVGGLDSLSHSGKIAFARKLASDLNEFCRDLAARAKAEYLNHKANFEDLEKDYGDGFAEIEPDRMHGLDFKGKS